MRLSEPVIRFVFPWAAGTLWGYRLTVKSQLLVAMLARWPSQRCLLNLTQALTRGRPRGQAQQGNDQTPTSNGKSP